MSHGAKVGAKYSLLFGGVGAVYSGLEAYFDEIFGDGVASGSFSGLGSGIVASFLLRLPFSYSKYAVGVGGLVGAGVGLVHFVYGGICGKSFKYHWEKPLFADMWRDISGRV